MKRCILIDGSGYLFRAYHALPSIHRSDGLPVNAALGFTSMLISLYDEQECDYWAVIFDAGRITFRNEIYPEYKANRPPAPEDLIPQFALVRDISKAMSIPTIEMPGYEADDLIASYSKIACKNNCKVDIFSSDKDLMQLVNKDINLIDPIRRKRIGIDEVIEKFGLPPDKLGDLLALSGDRADNIPGVPGIGVKTASLLINQYSDLENLLASVNEIDKPKRRESLIEFADQARLSRRLVELKSDIELPVQYSKLKRTPIEEEKLKKILISLEFSSILKRLETRWSNSLKNENKLQKSLQITKVDSFEKLVKWLKNIQFGTIAIDLFQHDSLGCCLAICHEWNCYCLLINDEIITNNQDFALIDEVPRQPSLTAVLDKINNELKDVLSNQAVLKVFFDAKKLWKLWQPYANQSYCDIKVLDAVYKGDRSVSCISKLQNYENTTTVNAFKTKKEIKSLTTVSIIDETARRSRCLLDVYSLINNDSLPIKTIYELFERPLIPVIAQMESKGVKIDRKDLLRVRSLFIADMDSLANDIYKELGTSFNLASPKQLGEVLFKYLDISSAKLTKSGSKKTGADVLEQLALDGHSIADTILAWRQAHKLKTTYCDGLLEYLTADDRIHTEYNSMGARTARLSSNNPNLQSIPVRTEEGKQLRRVFISSEKSKLISLDYNQIELRLLSHIANIEDMKKAFHADEDIHANTAKLIFGEPIDKISATKQRRQAKAINFGIIYGISAFGLAKQLSIETKEATIFIDEYHKRFPGIKVYMEKIVKECRISGYVSSLFGRKISIPDINQKNYLVRSYAERQAINGPIQASAADIIKRSMLKVDDLINDKYPKVKLLLQVHDELILESPSEMVDEVIADLTKVMENICIPLYKLDIPLKVDSGFGVNWGEAH